MKLLLTAEEAAQTLSISRTTIFEALRRGEIESVKIGRSRRIPIDAVERFIQLLRETQADGAPD